MQSADRVSSATQSRCLARLQLTRHGLQLPIEFAIQHTKSKASPMESPISSPYVRRTRMVSQRRVKSPIPSRLAWWVAMNREFSDHFMPILSHSVLCWIKDNLLCRNNGRQVGHGEEEWGRSFLLLLGLLQRRKNKGLAFLLRIFPILLCRGTKEIEKFSHSIRAKRKIYWQTNEFSQIEISVILRRDEFVLSSYPRHIVLWAAAVDVKFSHEKIEWLWDNSCALKITVILLNWIINYNNFPRRRDSMKKNMLHPRSLKQWGIISSSPVLSVARTKGSGHCEKNKEKEYCLIV